MRFNVLSINVAVRAESPETGNGRSTMESHMLSCGGRPILSEYP